MNQTALLLVIVLLAVVAAGFGYLYYQERQGGIAIQIDEHGVTIDGK